MSEPASTHDHVLSWLLGCGLMGAGFGPVGALVGMVIGGGLGCLLDRRIRALERRRTAPPTGGDS